MRSVGKPLSGRFDGIGLAVWLILLICLTPFLTFAHDKPGSPGIDQREILQAAPPVLIVRFVNINSGGGESSDGALVIRGTLGQALTGEADTCRETITSEQWIGSSETEFGLIWKNSFEPDPACE